jgi:hypothetical protein
MRTLVIIVAGLASLGLFALVAWKAGGAPSIPTAARIFIPIWLGVALVNMWLGVATAGYTVAEEFPIFLAIFLIPAAVAGVLWWRNS